MSKSDTSSSLKYKIFYLPRKGRSLGSVTNGQLCGSSVRNGSGALVGTAANVTASRSRK